jgi:hypothetical protein
MIVEVPMVIIPFALVTEIFGPAARLRNANVTLGVADVLCTSESYKATPVFGFIKVKVVKLAAGAANAVEAADGELLDVLPVPSAVDDVLNATFPVPDEIRLAPIEGIIDDP